MYMEKIFENKHGHTKDYNCVINSNFSLTRMWIGHFNVAHSTKVVRVDWLET